MKQYKILIVDDEEEICTLLSSILCMDFPHIEATLALNGQEAIEKLDQTLFHLIICDYSMPIKNGYQVFVHNQKKYNAPFIMLTGDFPDKYPELYNLTEIHPHNTIMTKPFSPHLMLETVQKILTDIK